MRRTTTYNLIATLLLVAWFAPQAAAELTVLASDADLGRKIDEAEKRIRNGNVPRGLADLQEAHETSHGRNRVLLGGAKGDVYESSVRRIVRLLQELGQDPKFVEQYRAAYDLAARSLFDRAVTSRDPNELLRTFELYPLSSVAFEAAVMAGDLFFEAAEPLRARDAWSWVTGETLESDAQQKLARRWVLLAAQTGDVKLHRRWWEQLEGAGVSPEQLPAAPAKRPDPLEKLPKVPFLKGELSGVSAGLFSRSRSWMGERRTNHYTQVPGVVNSWVAVTTLKKLRFFDPALGMKAVREVPFPRIRKRRVDGDRGNRSNPYQEYDKNLRLQPAAADGLVITSYVYNANQRQTYVGYLIREAIPHRGLQAYHLNKRSVVWDTRKCSDEIARDLSYRSTPVISEGKVYALGWRWAGLIDTYLVCFDLKTGALQWKTALVGNQVDLTMFGEINTEPFLGDVLVEGGRVFVQTNVGAIVAVRQWDGHLLWVTPYETTPLPAARQRQNKVLRKQRFKPSPIVSYEDRVIVAPLDSMRSLTLHKETGQILMWRKARGADFLVGQYGDYVIYCNRSSALRVPARDISGSGQTFSLSGDVNAMPALTREGLVYSCDDGLFLDRFRADQDSHLLVATPSIPGRESAPRRDGNVRILGDWILVTNSYRIQSFKGKAQQPPLPR
ncbi:MAG: PQQ-binding-like beta-propeller repeat protein [Planctomycetota bacterium]